MKLSGNIAEDALSKGEVYPCGVCSLRVMQTQFCMHNVVSASTLDVL